MISDLAKLLPHDAPMVLIDRLISYEENKIVVEVTIKDEYPFCGPFIGPWVAIEFMAQAAGVHAELTKPNPDEEVKIGFLLGTRRFTSNVSEFIPGSTVTVSVIREFTSDEGVSAATGTVFDSIGNILCEASLSLFQAKDNTLYLRDEP
ncbi:hypothetical protein [Polynucleobacter sp.]|uniref:ApeP family dehydratase n=1 Tax=Polynucleobacter sp. TaxID=2029855 RepID=UPI0037C5316A